MTKDDPFLTPAVVAAVPYEIAAHRSGADRRKSRYTKYQYGMDSLSDGRITDVDELLQGTDVEIDTALEEGISSGGTTNTELRTRYAMYRFGIDNYNEALEFADEWLGTGYDHNVRRVMGLVKETEDRVLVKETEDRVAQYERIDPDGADTDQAEYTFYPMETDNDVAESLLNTIYDEVRAARADGYDADELVLGAKQYEAIMTWCQSHHGVPPEDHLPVDDVIAVPGPMVHVRRPNRDVLVDHLEDDE